MKPRSTMLLAILACTAGCLGLKVPAPEVREYRLDYPPPAISAQPLPVVVRIAPFGTAAAYDRAAIVYRADAYATGAHFYERWVAHPASMIADLLARDLASAGIYQAVQQGASTLPSDYDLNGRIEEIEERVTPNGCLAHLRLRVLLTHARARDSSGVVFQKTYEADEACAGNEAEQFVAAMSVALQTISLSLQRDVHDAILQDRLP